MLDDFISAASLAPISLNQLTGTRLKLLRVNKCRKDLVSKLLWRVKKTSYLTAVTTFSITHLSFSCCASWFPCCNSFCTWSSVKVHICYLYSDVLLASRNFQTSIQIATCLVPMTGQTNSHTFCYHQPDPTFQPAQMTVKYKLASVLLIAAKDTHLLHTWFDVLTLDRYILVHSIVLSGSW
jgi:hypothetical protein